MAGSSTDQLMASHRSSLEAEPLISDTRSVRLFNGKKHNELGINLPSIWSKELHDVRQGDELEVDVYQDKFVVHAPEGGETDD